jgi:hypothetical protein
MLEKYKTTTKDVGNNINNLNEQKFQSLFDSEQQSYILKRLSKVANYNQKA